MAKTEITGDQVLDGTVARDDLDTTTIGQAVIAKVIAGANVSLTWTGADAGTGDVTVNFTGGGGGGAPNVISSIMPASSLQTLLNAIIGQVKNSAVITADRFSLRIDQKPAGLITTRADGSASVSQLPAGNLSNLVSGSNGKPVALPATRINRVLYSLSRRVGGNLTTLTTTNTQGWTNPNNAISGTDALRDGSSATFTGNALATRNGTLQLDYANSVNKTELVITLCRLHFYISVAGTTLNNADVQLKYNIGNGLVTLQTITGDVSNLTTPLTFDITSLVTAGGVQATIWGRIDALITQVVADSAIAEAYTVNLDAIEVEIVASKTDTL